ncbi:MAG: hypothetical protein AAGA54_23235 [Myxococcota bacterium]
MTRSQIASWLLVFPLASACIIETDASDDDGSTGGQADGGPSSTSAADSSSTTEGVDGSSGSGGASFEHCEFGPIDALSGDASGSFSEANELSQTQTMALSNPGGGYLEVTFDPGLARGRVEVFGTDDSVLFSTAEQVPESLVSLSGLIAEGASFRVEGQQALNANPDEYPFGWSLQWSVTPIPDCWEPNDTIAEAPDIALGVPISGYATAGATVGNEALPPEAWLDWYRVDVPEPGTLTVDMMQVPADGLLRTRVFDASGDPVGSITEPNDPMPYAGSVEIGAAGSYFVQVEPFLRPTLEVGDLDDGALADSWTTPYVFALTLEPAG